MLDATHPLTILAELDPERGPGVRAALDALAAELAGRDDLPDTHFTRLLLIDDPGRDEFPTLLAWESNYDGPLDAYLEAMVQAVPGLDAAFACCAGYPGRAEPAAWLAWLRARCHRPAAFYTAYRGVPRRRVVNDRALHAALRTCADAERADPACGKRSPRELHARLVAAARAAKPELDTSPPGSDELRWVLARALAAFGLVLALPLLLVVVGPWYAMLRRREATDPVDRDARPVYDDQDHHAHEDQDGVTQNQLTHLVDLRPGRFRLFTAWIVLAVIDLAASVIYVRGNLGGITDIHFARWVILRDRRPGIPAAARRHRLLFFSNYDGSWESYLGEFVDRATRGLTAVWSNSVGFPRTRGLLNEGAADEEAFKSWARAHQIHTEVWWTGVPTSTVQNVRDDLTLREGLTPPADDEAAAAWLELV